jgi:hypothetical protein
MKNKLFLFLAIILLTSTAFAAAPVLSDFQYDKNAVADHNYGNWITSSMYIQAKVTGADLNKDNCWYGIDGTFTQSANDMNTDTNIFRTGLNVPALTDDVNWCLMCINESDENSNQLCQTIYGDGTPPTTAATFDDAFTITLTATDAATTTGNGSGVKRIFYSLDGDPWLGSTNNPTTIRVTDPGSHRIYFCSMDNLDNNECVSDMREKPFTVRGVSNSACQIFDLVPLILAAILLISLVIAIKVGAQIDAGLVPLLVMGAIIVIIAIIVYTTILNAFCGIL